MRPKIIAFVILICLVGFSVFASGGSFEFDNSMPVPDISSYGVPIPGGLRYTIKNNVPGSTLYYGVIGFQEYIALMNGNGLNTGLLYLMDSSTEESIDYDIKKPVDGVLFASSVLRNSASFFSRQTVNVKGAGVGAARYISRGVVRESGSGVYYDLYASLSPNMDNEKLIRDGLLPTEFIGKYVYFQERNYMGYADSDIVGVKVDGGIIPKPHIDVDDDECGQKVLLIPESINIGDRNWAPKEDFELFYTLDGSDPSPESSIRYVEPFVIDKVGNYTVKAIEVYKGLKSDYSSSRNIIVRETRKPEVYISGLDITVKCENNVYAFSGNSENEINTKGSHILVNEDDVGKTIYIQARRRGCAPSDTVEVYVETLKEFQERYSQDLSRQVGNWKVLSDGLFVRWPYGENMYMMAVALFDKYNKVNQMVFSNPSVGCTLNDFNKVFLNSKSIIFNDGERDYKIPFDVYIITRSMEASYVIVANVNTAPEFIDLLNSGKSFTTIATLQGEINGLDVLKGLGQSLNTVNPDATYKYYLQGLELGESQFVFSTEGLTEAINYYTTVINK